MLATSVLGLIVLRKGSNMRGIFALFLQSKPKLKVCVSFFGDDKFGAMFEGSEKARKFLGQAIAGHRSRQGAETVIEIRRHRRASSSSCASVSSRVVSGRPQRRFLHRQI